MVALSDQIVTRHKPVGYLRLWYGISQAVVFLLIAVIQLYFQAKVGDIIGWVLFVLALILVCGVIFLVYAVARWYMGRIGAHGSGIFSDDTLLAQIAKLSVRIEEMKVEHQREIDALNLKHQREIEMVESERSKLEKRVRDNASLRKRLLTNKEDEEAAVTKISTMTPLLVVIGQDAALQLDEGSLRAMQGKTGRGFRRVRNATLERMKDHLERGRINKRPYRHIHLAVHSQPDGIYLGGEIVTGLQLSELLKGVEILLIAGCESATIGDRLGGVKWVLTMVEQVPNEDAAVFAQAFWTEIGLGQSPPDALAVALEAAPSGMDEYVEYHWG